MRTIRLYLVSGQNDLEGVFIPQMDTAELARLDIICDLGSRYDPERINIKLHANSSNFDVWVWNLGKRQSEHMLAHKEVIQN